MNPQTVNIRILDKEYQVSCPPEERDALLLSARALESVCAQSATVVALSDWSVLP